DVDGAFWTHDRDFRGGPGKIRVSANVLAGHDAVRSAVSLAGDDGDFGDGGFGEREEKLCAVLDDAAKFLLRAGKEARDIFERNQRDVEGIAESNEASTFDAGVDIENAGEDCGLIGNYADRLSVETRETYDDVFGEVLVDFEEIVVVDDGMDGVLDVVRLLRIVGDQCVESGILAIGGVGGGAAGGGRPGVGGGGRRSRSG